MSARPPGGGLLRRSRDFRLLWCGETTGKFGDAVATVAMPLIAVGTLHASTFRVSLLSAAIWLAWLLIGLPVGVWVDRWRRRPVMLAAAAVSTALFAAVPVARWTGCLDYPVLLGVALATGAAAVFFQTAYAAYLPGLVAPEDRAEGNAKLNGSASAAQIAGTGAGGLIAQVAGAVGGMLANSATFAVSLVCLTAIRHREPRADRAVARRARGGMAKEIAEGLRVLAADPWLRTGTLFGAVANLVLTASNSIDVVFLVRVVGLSPGTVGLLFAAGGTGGVAGALIARRISERIGTARAFTLMSTVLLAFDLLIPLTARGAGTAFFVVGAFCLETGVVAGNVIWATFRQHRCPPELYGRLIAGSSFVNYGLMPLGAVLGGTLATVLGLRATMWVAAAILPLAGLALLLTPVGRARDLPTDPIALPTADGTRPTTPAASAA
ncbi:MFS transporter [Streptomyces sp. PTM05]|uniref:MFS transporter n=1 Tax=Streptantibioticus parmotrematis TaxID=2873249 RepID=A0ABS7QN06_9ACTN|nr:MFS transporter [Streptantibioticus parmotrematis]MBY8884571.1 MFS transporter [Streptantibioticus parmotrematis]